jgi:hypothetical protein
MNIGQYCRKDGRDNIYLRLYFYYFKNSTGAVAVPLVTVIILIGSWMKRQH